jgi:hypothetical protein
MLFDWAISVSIVLSIILAAVVASVLLDNIFVFRSNRSPLEDPIEEALLVAKEERKRNRKSIYQQLAIVYANNIVTSCLTLFTTIFELPGIVIGAIRILWQNRQLLVLLLFTSSVAYVTYGNNALVLEKLDGLYSCAITPFVNNILFSILHVVNLFWASVTPFLNIITLLFRQLIAGSVLIASKCATSTLSVLRFQKDLTNVFVNIFTEILNFTGLTDNDFRNSNMFFNPFRVYPIAASWRELFMWVPETLACFCQATSRFTNLVFYGLIKVDYLDYAAHHAFNTILSFAQTFLQIVPPFLKYPDFENTFFHYSMAFTELCELLDAWIFEALNVILETMNVDGGGIIIERPKIFLFETIAHLNSFASQLIYIQTNGFLRIVLPFAEEPITNTKFMASLFKLEDAFIHLNLFVNSFSHFLSWLLRVAIELLMSAYYKNICSSQNFKLAVEQGAACVNFVDGQCSTSCLSQTKIKIHDIENICMLNSDAKNKYNAQKTEFQSIIDEVKETMPGIDISNTNVTTFSQKLPLHDGPLTISLQRQNEFLITKISLEGLPLRERFLKDGCTKLFMHQRADCYEELLDGEFERAYGAVGGSSLYKIFACSLESFLLIPINLVEITQSYYTDYFWFNIIEALQPDASAYNNRANGLALLRSYSGPWFGRDYDPPCLSFLNSTRATEQGIHFNTIDQYKAFLDKNRNKCNRPNFNEHVFYHMDRLGFFIFSNLLEKETFGKILFNLYRLVIEQFRISWRLDAEGYFFLSIQSFFDKGEVTFPDFSSRWIDREIGCQYNYGNQTNDVFGYCRDLDTTMECDVYGDLNNTTPCGCISNPGIVNADYVTVATENTRYYTTKAIKRWCLLNAWEFNYVFLARAFNGIRNLITAFSIDNLVQGFPPENNICDQESYQFSFSTTIQDIFGETCEVIAYKDFMCPTGELLQRIYLALSRYLRKEQRNFWWFFENRANRMEMSLVPHVCDAQNAIMALANMVSTFFLKKDMSLQKPLTRALFSVFNLLTWPLEFVALFVRTLRAFITGDPTVLDTGRVTDFKSIAFDTVKSLLSKSITKLVDSVVYHVIDICQSLKSFLNSIVPCSGGICAGSIFDVIQTIFVLLQKLLSDVTLPLLLDFLEVVFSFVSFLVQPASINEASLSALITKVLDLLTKSITALSSNASVWANFLFETFLGPVGDIITAVRDSLCGVISFANTIGLGMDASFCGITAPVVSVTTSDVGDFFSGLFSRRRLLEASNQSSVLHHVAVNMTWDDHSRCDRIIMAYKDYDVNELRPLEKIEWLECFQLRLTADILESKFHVGLPKDIFYNWIRKYTVGIDVVSVSFIYIQWYLQDGKRLPQLKLALKKAGFEPQHVLNFAKHLRQMYNDVVSWKNLKRSLEQMWNKNGDSRGTRVYNNLKQLHTHVTQTKWTASFVASQKAMHHFYSNHITMPDGIDVTHVNVFSEEVRGMLELRKQIEKQTFGNIFGAFTDLKCPKDSILCLQCAVVDNFLYNGLLQIQSAGNFYRQDFANVIVPTFEAYWENTSQYNARYTKAYRRAFEEKLEEANNRYGGTLQVTLSFGDFVSGLLEGTYGPQELIDGISYFLQGNYTGQIPSDAKIMFANDLQYYLNLPFDGNCDTADWKWKSSKDEVGSGLWNVLLLFLGVEFVRLFIFEFNILITAAIYIAVSVVAQLLYLYSVYNYNPSCYPVMPSYLVYDFLMWTDENVFLECACSYVPYLSKEVCVQQTCDTCAITTTFKDCRVEVPEFEQLGLLYHFVFFFRWYWPEQFRYFGKLTSWPFPYLFSNSAMQSLLSDVDRNLQVSGVEMNCFYVNLMMPVSVIIVTYIGFIISIPLLRIAVTWVRETVMAVMNTILILFYLNQASSS